MLPSTATDLMEKDLDQSPRRALLPAVSPSPGGNTFTGTRPGGAIAAAWAVMHFLGEAGYRRIAATVMEAKARFVEGLARIGGGPPRVG